MTYIQIGWSVGVLLLGAFVVWWKGRHLRRLARAMRDAGQLIQKDRNAAKGLSDLAARLPAGLVVPAPAIEETRTTFRELSSLLKERETWLSVFVHELKNDFLPLLSALERSHYTDAGTKRIIDRIRSKLNNVTTYQNALFVDPDTSESTELTSLLQFIAYEIEDIGGDIFLEESDVIYVAGRTDDLDGALKNLILNSHIYGGSVKINVRKNDKDKPDMAIIEIRDDGPGMSEDHITEALKPYAQLKQSKDHTMLSGDKKKPPFKGAGLGLAIAKNVIENHGGQLKIQNRSAVGDTVNGLHVRVLLPLKTDL